MISILFNDAVLKNRLHELKTILLNFDAPEDAIRLAGFDLSSIIDDIALGESAITRGANGELKAVYSINFGERFEKLISALREKVSVKNG